MLSKLVAVATTTMFARLTYENINNPIVRANQAELSMAWVMGIVGVILFVPLLYLSFATRDSI